MKICIVTTSLGFGGAERSAAMQSIMLTELGYDVHIVLISNIISFEYKGTLYNLGLLKEKSNSLFDKIKRIILLRKYIKNNDFDFVIDNRMRTNSIINEIGICKYAYPKLKVLYVIHSFSYKKEVQEKPYLKKWLLKDGYKIVVVNNKLLKAISEFHNLKKMVTIENAIDVETISLKAQESFNLSFPYILFCGRLDEGSKNVSLLIKAFEISEIFNKGVKLIILGDGPDRKDYEHLIASLKMKRHVLLEPFTSNPFVYMKHALCTVLTSFYEGFGLVLIESLAAGTPVVAINCETGPSDIIDHNINGLLLEGYNVNELSKALRTIVNEEDRVNRFKNNSLESVRRFSKERISMKWRDVLES